MNTVINAFKYLESFTNLEKTTTAEKREYRLDRMVKLLQDFGNPHENKKIYHIAGSKGKGSTSFYLATLLQGAGHRTGLYQSPHIVNYTERITLAGQAFEDQIYIRTIHRIKKYIEEHKDYPGGEPTTFELLTLAAFIIYHEQGCTHLVLETGMGGRLDATNVVTPLLSIITPIELEHTQYLGDSLDLIAREKGGIIKEGVPCLISAEKPEVIPVFREITAQRHSRLYELKDLLTIDSTSLSPGGVEAKIQWNGTTMHLNLASLNTVQVQNSCLALTALHITGELPEQALDIIQRTRLPGRMEIKSHHPYIVVDGSHTEDSLGFASEAFHSGFQEMKPKVLVFGLSEGKDALQLAPLVARGFDHIIVTRAGTFRPQDPHQLGKAFFHHNYEVIVEGEPRQALEKALDLAGKEGAVLVTGSFHLIGEIYPFV
ncbi:bifunctional folylpolyglutamate synthase/dihydrofolate synthase [Spirochaeta cellobiosiphila]|uniref:bifunctional folylpolyglutamate synthase/dihydrofolate synthase n=1 Tax=Spirochaeta cellobiosiphila TaxID=504483 RepID=UPI0003FB7382|nr:folylpolyglutamate synthase/dihydrofolate synthase family protein [Spirochaeta cellobiosiphila]